jgi:Rrf2 family protein
MLPQTSRYLLSILCYLARQTGRRVPAREIAAATGAPPNYVGKIMGVLGKRQVVSGRKGWGGGFALTPNAADLALGELLGYFGEYPGPVACPFLEPQCGCPLARTNEVAQLGGPATEVPRAGGPAVEGRAHATVCPFGAAECLVAVPCPLHAHWAKVREGFWGVAGTAVSEMIPGHIRPAGQEGKPLPGTRTLNR